MLILMVPNAGLGQHEEHKSTNSNRSNPSQAMFEKMKNLVGIWEGTYEWTGVMEASGTLKVQYYLSGMGSALIENILSDDGVVTMTSVYHLDHDKLRATHYCAANNQPRLIAKDIENSKKVTFEFVDITNLTSIDMGHVNGITLELMGPEQHHIVFDYVSSKGKSVERIALRKQSSND